MKPDELEELYRRYYRPLFLYAYSLTHRKEDAEDLTANTFVKALTTFRTGNIQAWLYAVLRNEFYDLRKKQKWKDDFDTDAVDQLAAADDVLQTYIENEERQWLYGQISRLPQREREVMLLTVQLGGRDKEIGEILGLTVDHVRVLRHRAKTRIIKNSKEEQP